MFGPQVTGADNGRLYFSSIEFARPTGNYLAGTERDIFVRSDLFAASGPGTNLTSGLTGNMLWAAISPDNVDMAVIRKLSTGNTLANIAVDAQPVGVGQIVTINLSPFAPTGEQIDVTASAKSRICYVASKGIAPAGGGARIDPDKYYIAFTRSFYGGVTNQIELLRNERTPGPLGAFITQWGGSDPSCAAIHGPDGPQFTVRNPRDVMCFRTGTEIRMKNITSPATGGMGWLITTVDADLSATNIPSQPTFPAPFDVFDPLPR